jgi:chromosomal replication initiator protein
MAEWDYKIFWDETTEQLRQELGEEEFTIWFSNLEYIKASEIEIIIAVPSFFFQEQFRPRYHKRIEDKIRELTGKNLAIVLQVAPRNQEESKSERKTEETPKSISQIPKKAAQAVPPKEAVKKRHHQLRDDYTFDKYVIGENNSFAANAAIAISRNPGNAYNPFLIYGGVGLGKTHLMQAIGNYIYENSDSKIIYITAENFLNEFIQAISDNKISANKMSAFKNKFRYVDVLLIDDIHFFQDKPGVQEELFHTFNTLLDAKKQLAFTCDRPVSELKKISERLKSRFEQCLNVDLQPPKYETRCAILKSTIESQNVDIPGEVIDLISKNVSTNIRDLIAALNKLIAYTKLMGQPITLENAQQQLRDVFASPKQANLSIDIVQRVVADFFSVSPIDIKGKKKTKNIVFPRHISMYLARDMTEYSTTEIGQSFGGRDHTTVMYSCQKIEDQIRTDPNLYSTLQTLRKMIRESGAKN